VPGGIDATTLPDFLDLTQSYTAKQLRQSAKDIMHEGTLSSDDLIVVPKGGSIANPDAGGASRDRSVDVLLGAAYIYDDDDSVLGGAYRVQETRSASNVALDVNASGNPRIDLIVAHVYGSPQNKWRFESVNGTPAASPSPPATPNNCIALAQVTVVNGATQITAAQIADVRIRARGNAYHTNLVSDVNTTLSTFTNILAITFTISRKRLVGVGGSARFVANLGASGANNGVVGLRITDSVTGVVVDSFAGPATINNTTEPGRRAALTIPMIFYEFAAGSHTVRLTCDRDGSGDITAQGQTTQTATTYTSTILSVYIP
jgi:hypothetical protein